MTRHPSRSTTRLRGALKLAVALLIGALALPWLGARSAFADDLVIDFDVDPPTTINAGESFTFVLEVFDDDDDTGDVVLEYFIPEGVTVIDVESSSGDPLDCQAGTSGDPFNPLSCRLGEVDEDDDSIFIEITVRVDPSLPLGSVIDTDAQVCTERDESVGKPGTSCQGDDFPPDNELHWFTRVTTLADLSLVGQVDPANVQAGQPTTFRFAVANTGPSVARGAFFRGTLPPGLIFRDAKVLSGDGEALGAGFTCDYSVGPRQLSCELGDLGTGLIQDAQRFIDIDVRTDPGIFPLPTNLILNASVFSAETADPNPGNDAANPTLAVTDRAVLEVRKSSTPLNPTAGETFLWTYEVRNNGPTNAWSVEFTDTLPQGTTSYGETVYFEYVDDQAQGFCTLTGNAPDVISCRPAGNAFTNPPFVLGAGESVEFSILVHIDPRMPPGQYTNLASVNVSNNNFTVTSFGDDIEVKAEADLRVSKFVSPSTDVRAGEQFTYTILVDNLGPSTAYNVVITDTLISSGFVSANGCSLAVRTDGGLIDEFDCNFATATGVFDLATMGSNHLNPRSPTDQGRILITINATADDALDLTNVTTVTSDSFDPNTDNNIATVTHSVTAVADLSLSKVAQGEIQVVNQEGTIVDLANPPAFPEAPNYTVSPNAVTAGRRIRYGLVLRNEGPSTAENAVIRDDLPAGVTVVPGSVGITKGSCNLGDPGEPLRALVCGVGTLASGEEVELVFDVLVDDGILPNTALVNDAQAYSDTFDLTNSNDFATAETVVNTWADMEIIKLSVGEVVTGCDDDLDRHILEDLPGQVTAGNELRYEITVQNKGASDAQHVQILDLLPGQTDTGLDHDPVTFLYAEGASCRPADELQEIGVFNPGGGKFGQVLWCDLGTVAAGERVTFDIHVQVDPAVPDATTLTNGAFVWWGASSPPAAPGTFLPFPFPQIPPALPTTDDPFLDDNFADTDTQVTAVADLVVEKTSDPVKVFAGEQKRYTIRVKNEGPSVARDVFLTDALPPEVSFEIQTLGPACIVDTFGPRDIVECDLGDLEPWEEVIFDIWVLVDPMVPPGTTITNEVEVATTTTEFCLNNNVDTRDNLVLSKADLKITKVVSPHTPVRAGDNFTYTLIVDNLGPSAAWNVIITDTLISEGFVQPLGCTLTVQTNGNPATAMDCLAAASIGVYDLATFGVSKLNVRSPQDPGRVIVELVATADQEIDLTNISTVTSDSYDPDQSNNMAMVAHEVTAVADLRVTKAAVGEIQVAGQEGTIVDLANPPAFPEAPNYATDPDEVTAGRRIRYTLTVTNGGPSRAENVVLHDDLVAGVTLVPGTLVASQGSCNAGTPGEPLLALTCGLGLLEAGQTETVTFDVLVASWVAPNSTIVNDAQVWSDTFDPDNVNDFASTQTVVNTWADMEITKLSVGQNKVGYDNDLRRFIFEDLPGEVTAGHELRYEISVQNKGASDAQNVQILDLLPGQLDTGLDHDPVTFLYADGASCRPLDEQQELGVFGPAGGKFGQVLWCDLGPIAAGERVTFDVYVSVDSAVPDGFTLTNGAFVWWGPSSPPAAPGDFSGFPFPQIPPTLPTTDDPFLDDNFAETDTNVNAVADVYIQKVDVPAEPRLDMAFEPDKAIAGNEHRYKITFGNHGWSVARDIAIQDFLDFQLFGVLGETFLRCEPFDIDDFVSCSENNGVVDVDLLLRQNEQIIPGDLNPGDEYSFYLITDVAPGYVLDALDFIATNDSRITTTTTDFHTANNVDAHDTLIVAEADLALDLTDVPLVMAPFVMGAEGLTSSVRPMQDNNGFLSCDPVEPGGMLTYELTVENLGPSDAAQVVSTVWLPSEYVVVDPAQVEVEFVQGEGLVEEVRDDGRITLVIGNDPNVLGVNQIGRLNVGSEVVVHIRVMVRLDAECGGTATARAEVTTRRNDVIWPPAPDLQPGVGGGPRTPTPDPNLANNVDDEDTTVECPAIKVVKTVSYDGTCPGQDLPIVWNQTAQPVTFCFEITNTGTTYLDTIRITDTLTTRTQGMPMVIFTDTITSGVDPKLPVSPGETVKRQVTIPHLTKDCGLAYDRIDVTANPVNSGRTDLPCLNDVTHFDEATIEIPCAGVDRRLALPILNDDNGDCEAWIQVQNVGDKDAKAMLVVWGDPGFCPPQAAGPLKVECSGLLAPGSAWSFAEAQVPSGARSAVVYSLSNERVEVEPGTRVPFADAICEAAFFGVVGDYFEWLVFDTAYRTGGTYDGFDFSKYTNEPLAVSVNRSCPDMVDPAIANHAAYTGISSDMFGARDPRGNAYTYYAPLIFNEKRGLTTWIYAQNTGEECTSLEIWFKAQDNCLRATIADVLALAPGESVHLDASTMGPDWLGSAWIRSTQPMALVVDTMGANHFTSYTGLPADSYELDFTYGNQVNFAPLIYSEYQGWDTAIQVQNLSATHAAKAKVYFLDRSGDIITTLVDWICPRGSQTFFLPVIESIPGNWVGSARVESQEWWTPGSPLVDPPKISSVVLLEKWSDPARTGLREAVAYNAQTECLLFDWQIAPGTKGGTSSGSAVFAIPLVAKGNRGITSEIGITNLVPKPGFTDFAIFLYDQNGLIDWVCQKLNEKQVEYIDLSTWGIINQGFLGSAVVSAVFWEHDVFDGSGNFERNLVGLGGVAVERIGGTQGGPDVPGDESKAFEALPIFDHFDSGEAPNCPGVGTP